MKSVMGNKAEVLSLFFLLVKKRVSVTSEWITKGKS